MQAVQLAVHMPSFLHALSPQAQQAQLVQEAAGSGPYIDGMHVQKQLAWSASTDPFSTVSILVSLA